VPEHSKALRPQPEEQPVFPRSTEVFLPSDSQPRAGERKQREPNCRIRSVLPATYRIYWLKLGSTSPFIFPSPGRISKVTGVPVPPDLPFRHRGSAEEIGPELLKALETRDQAELPHPVSCGPVIGMHQAHLSHRIAENIDAQRTTIAGYRTVPGSCGAAEE
jgi:hypothetical protein